ncbi:MAG: 4Fe-4S dicluster domain-containing protein [Prolixibacteraceae bacterium]|nr:4Fe-4S dicluster domain-containing protein [Prolixibacteraceae bacterium]
MRLYNFLKKGRRIIAAIILVITFLLFIDIYEWIPQKYFRAVLDIQFVPSLLDFITTFSIIAGAGFIIVLLLTLFTGRIYCSIFCPLGIIQDIINRVSRSISKKKRFFKFKKPHPVLRYTFLGIMILAIAFGLGWITVWLDPYSMAGRTFTYLFKPLIVWGNNLVILPIFRKLNIYFTYHHALLQPYLLPVILTFITIAAIGYFAWKRGRLFCNTICPVGTLLGEISRFSFLKVRFDHEKCTRCGKCAGVCKSECIDIKNYNVDYSRCVVCFNCLDICPESALALNPSVKYNIKVSEFEPTPNIEVVKSNNIYGNKRRKIILTILALLAGNRIFALKKNQMPENKKDLIKNEKDYPVAPPGAGNIERFNNICTGCSLCIAACPTGVLQPALAEYGLMGFMQPHMDYITNYCNFDCLKCGEVCPTKAILPLSMEDKHLTQIGKAIFVEQNCVVYTDETDCGACSEHCPTKAVKMVPYKNGLLIPEVDDTICIGCGACEHACPVEAPFKAIYVNGNFNHKFAEKPQDDDQKQPELDEGFPF